MFNDITLSNKTFMKKEFNENVNLDIINSLYDSKAVSSNDQFEKFPEGNQKGWQKGRVRGFGFKCGRGVRQDGFQCSLTQKIIQS